MFGWLVKKMRQIGQKTKIKANASDPHSVWNDDLTFNIYRPRRSLLVNDKYERVFIQNKEYRFERNDITLKKCLMEQEDCSSCDSGTSTISSWIFLSNNDEQQNTDPNVTNDDNSESVDSSSISNDYIWVYDMYSSDTSFDENIKDLEWDYSNHLLYIDDDDNTDYYNDDNDSNDNNDEYNYNNYDTAPLILN